MLQISLWKRALIVLLALSAIVFAVPNLFYDRVERHNDALVLIATGQEALSMSPRTGTEMIRM